MDRKGESCNLNEAGNCEVQFYLKAKPSNGKWREVLKRTFCECVSEKDQEYSDNTPNIPNGAEWIAKLAPRGS